MPLLAYLLIESTALELIAGAVAVLGLVELAQRVSKAHRDAQKP